jgi:uncharacterized protein (TIRG00374 family)
MLTKKRLILALKFAVSGLLIWFLLSNIDLDNAGARIVEMDLALFASAIGIAVVQTVPATLRWKAVLDAIGARLDFWMAWRFFYIGAFFNQILPSSVGGDAVRIYVAHRAGLTLSGAINGVMLERVATVLALIILVAALQPLFQARIAEEAAVGWIVPVLAVLAVAVLAGTGLLMSLDRLPERLHRWSLVRGLTYLAGDTRKVFLTPAALAKALAWAVVGHVNISLSVYALALGLHLEVTATDCITLVPLVILVTTVPISIAGWGVREGAMVVAFGLVGVSPDSAVVLSVLLGIAVIISSLPGGVLWLLSGARRRDVAIATDDGAMAGPPEAS